MMIPSRIVPRRDQYLLPGIVVMLILASAIFCPATTSASPPGHYTLRAYRAIRFRVHGSHGFAIGVAEGSRRHITVTVRRGSLTAEYEGRAPRALAEYELRGRLGRLGDFNVHFTSRGKPRHLARYSFCTGPGPTIQPGTVRGKIRFEGERDYTRATARLAPAELETVPRQRCHYGELGHSKHPLRYTATLDAEGFGSDFSALRFSPGSRPPAHRVFYEADGYERLGSLRIVRKIRLSTDTSTFRLPSFSVAPENAVIQPPAPFTGSATFARTPESTFIWTGDLAVTFPGADPIPLTGPDFRLHYCALRSCVNEESAEERSILEPARG